MKSGRKKRRPVLLMMLIIALLLGTCMPVSAAEVLTNQYPNWPKGPELTSETAILYDADSHAVLYDKGIHEVHYPASTTKLMTALLAIENFGMDTQIIMDQRAINDVVYDSTNINAQYGEIFTLEDALHAILLASANEVSTQVAEFAGGSVENFAMMMNQRAQELGCQNTHFTNANGLHDDNHYTTAYDLALIMSACIKSETFRRIESDLNYTIQPTNMTPDARVMQQHHVMMLNGQWHYEGVFAGKTGFTDQAQHVLVTACTRDDHTLISVTMGSENVTNFDEAKLLLDYGYENFHLEHAMDEAGNELPEYVSVPNGMTLDSMEVHLQETSSPRDPERSFMKYWSLGDGILGLTTFTAPLEEEETTESSSEDEKQEVITTEEILSGIGGDNSTSNLSKAEQILGKVTDTCKAGFDIASTIAMTLISEIREGNPDSPILIFILADAAALIILFFAILQQRRHRRRKRKLAKRAREAARLKALEAEKAAAALSTAQILAEAPAVEEAPVAEEAPVIEEAPVAKEVPAVEETPVVKEAPAVEKTGKKKKSLFGFFHKKSAEPAREEAADPVSNTPPVKEPVAEAAKEPVAEPVKEAANEPVAEPVKEAANEPVAEPVKEAANKPAAEPVKEAVVTTEELEESDPLEDLVIDLTEEIPEEPWTEDLKVVDKTMEADANADSEADLELDLDDPLPEELDENSDDDEMHLEIVFDDPL